MLPATASKRRQIDVRAIRPPVISRQDFDLCRQNGDDAACLGAREYFDRHLKHSYMSSHVPAAICHATVLDYELLAPLNTMSPLLPLAYYAHGIAAAAVMHAGVNIHDITTLMFTPPWAQEVADIVHRLSCY